MNPNVHNNRTRVQDSTASLRYGANPDTELIFSHMDPGLLQKMPVHDSLSSGNVTDFCTGNVTDFCTGTDTGTAPYTLHRVFYTGSIHIIKRLYLVLFFQHFPVIATSF
jgi:hypothetical protein